MYEDIQRTIEYRLREWLILNCHSECCVFFCCCECYDLSVVCIRICLSNRCFVVNLLHGGRDLKVKGDSPEELLVSLGLFNTILGVCIYICVHLKREMLVEETLVSSWIDLNFSIGVGLNSHEQLTQAFLQ